MRKPPIYPTFAIGTHNLETVTQMKVLGVIIQNDLKWDRNVDNIVKRANYSKIHMLRVVKCHGLSSHDLMTIILVLLDQLLNMQLQCGMEL